MLSQAQVAAALPLLLVGLITAIMVPLGERLVLHRLPLVDPDAIKIALDLYTIVTLLPVIPIIGLVFAPWAAANGRLIGLLYGAAFIANLVALVLVLTTADYHRYVTKRRLLVWSFPTWMNLAVMVIAAGVSAILS